jgi:hypothetical protein
LLKLKNYLILLPTGKPSDFRIKYEIGSRIEIFDNKPVVQKKIGNALVVHGEPKSIYDDRYGFQKEKIDDYAGHVVKTIKNIKGLPVGRPFLFLQNLIHPRTMLAFRTFTKWF